MTTLYYLLRGSEWDGRWNVLLHAATGDVRAVEPVADTLLVIRGDQLHSVAPLTAGTRTTVVTNVYAGG